MPSYYDQYGPDFDMGGGNAARDYDRYSQSSDFARSPPGNPFAAFARMFGRGQPNGAIQSAPLPPLPGTTQTGGPFGGPTNAPAEPKPTTQLASNGDIMRRIMKLVQSGDLSSLLQPPDAGDYINWSDLFPQGGDQNALPQFAQQSPTSSSGRYGDYGSHGLSPFNVFAMAPPARPQRIRMHAMGGQHPPGYMRGGYPELYNVPVRRTFDSGGESYVGSQYGNSSGRADDVNARLSPKEYVVDAETMALLGDGNPDDGAKKMDQLRANIRKHKGKKLAKGEISPDAKPASSYIAGSPMSDGIRRAGRKDA